MNKTRGKVYQILTEFFYVLTGAIVVFVIMELAWENIVLSYLNLNWVLIGWVINGIVLLVMSRR
ncbi:MAG: hypothetical protein ABIE43_01460 [Patescibacteria group bacterium]